MNKNEDKSQTSLVNLITPRSLIKDLMKLNPFANQKEVHNKINKIFSNEKGSCVIGLCNRSMLVICPEYQLTQEIN